MANEQKVQAQKEQPKAPPAPPPKPQNDAPTPASMEQQLREYGFEYLYNNAHGEGVWQDPDGEGSRHVDPKGVAIRLPEKNSETGEKEKIVYQGKCPPASWKYTTSQAYRIMKQRQAAGGSEGTPLMRLQAMGEKLDALYAIHEELVRRLEPLTRGVVPEKKENLAALVIQTRGQLAAALGEANAAWASLQPEPISINADGSPKRPDVA